MSNIFNTRVDNLPVHQDSKQLVANIGGGSRLHADFASKLWRGEVIGIPITTYTRRSDVPKWFKFDFQYAAGSDHVDYPIAAIESPNGHFNPAFDHHMIAIIEEERKAYEVFQADTENNRAGSGAVWDMDSDNMRPWGWTSADASGYPMYKGILRFDEVRSGRIEHAIRFTVPRTWSNKNNASHKTDGLLDAVPSPQFRPAMGERFRLRADYDISGFGPQARVFLQCLKEYGGFVADNGMAWGFTGEPHPEWDDDQFADLPFGSAMEVVDCSEWGLIKGSYAVPFVVDVPVAAGAPSASAEIATLRAEIEMLQRTVTAQNTLIESLKRELATAQDIMVKTDSANVTLTRQLAAFRNAPILRRLGWLFREPK
jgi:hypothetical protein